MVMYGGVTTVYHQFQNVANYGQSDIEEVKTIDFKPLGPS